MRWLFLVVLVMNLAYIVWGMSGESTKSQATIAPLKNVEPIMLLSELVLEKEVASTSTVSIEPESSVKVVEASAESVEMVPPTSNEALKTVEIVPENIVVEKVQDKAAQSAVCFTLGPFRDLEKLRGFTREIKSYVVSADFRGREEKEQALYWVYLQPEKNHAKAVAMGKRLKAKKIKDFYIIRDGEKVNGLSLGHFRNKTGAYDLGKKVKNLGFDVVVEPVYKSYTVYWLDYQLGGEVEIPQAIFDKYITTENKNKISRLHRDCAA